MVTAMIVPIEEVGFESDDRIPPSGQSGAARGVNDEWRRRIAESLLLGQTSESILETMIASG